MKKLTNKCGFTLIELMIAMAIFVIFMGVLMNSYAGIVRSQKEANDYRVLYSEAREVFGKVSETVKNSAINYNQIGTVNFNSGIQDLEFVSKGGDEVYRFSYREDEGKVYLGDEALNSDEIFVKDFVFFVSPKMDPYNPDSTKYASLQFQPKVTIYGKFEKELSNGRTYEIDLRTTISSRFYNVTPKINE